MCLGYATYSTVHCVVFGANFGEESPTSFQFKEKIGISRVFKLYAMAEWYGTVVKYD